MGIVAFRILDCLVGTAMARLASFLSFDALLPLLWVFFFRVFEQSTS